MTPDLQPPHPLQFRGSSCARLALRWMGWQADFDGLPTPQGVVVVYPHTSNWDFVVGLLLKWSLGVPLQFWAKDSLFRIPLFGRWLAWLGGVPVNRKSSHGVVGQMARLMAEKKQKNEYFWLALSPEGTRGYTPGWRSGFYRVALEAGVPVGLAGLDYARKKLVLRHFVQLTGDEPADMTRIADALGDCQGLRPNKAAPVRLPHLHRPATDTMLEQR
ncbi:1-acyl-sn-glycerol-3-phosphate acyltransferase [Polaromonas sp. YR568]|uniref:1-acyl-sn-glycerol-3-phosphate acyltransferase n=1 Tax=Polaromonas sp. YR568 TaxID=1855301 RepID=UPI003137994F